MKILYVEDELPHVELAQRALEDNLKENFVLLHSESYKGALVILDQETDIDLVLTDYRLPDGSGMDLIKHLQKIPSPPAVVLITGQGDEQVAVAAIKAGATDYLVKHNDYLHRLPITITNAVAQRKLEQEQLAKLESDIRYQSLVEQTPAVVFLDDVDDNETTLYISPRIEELTGYTPEEWQSDPFVWENHIHPEDQERILALDRNSHSIGERFQEEYRFIRRDGEVTWIKEDTNLIRDKDGKPLYWQGILIDITKEKDNEVALQRQLRELTVLNGISAASAESDSEDEVIQRVVQISTLLFNEVCGVLMLNDEGDILTPHPSYVGADITKWPEGVPVTQGVSGRSVLEGKTIRLGDVSKDPAFIKVAEGIRSELCVPIRVNKRIIGIFNVESTKPNAYTEYDENLLNTIAGNLGTSLENIRLFKEEKRRSHELNALYQSTKPLSQSLEPSIIASNLLKIMDDLLGYEYSSIYLIDSQKNVLFSVAVSPKAQQPEVYEKNPEHFIHGTRSLDTGILGWVARNGKVFRSGDVQSDIRYFSVIKGINSELCVPLIARDKVIGVINIETVRPNAYSQRDEDLLITIANSAAITLENARLYETERLLREEAEALRKATASLSLYIDLDPLLDQILTSIYTIVSYDSASVFLGVEDGDMEIVATRGLNDQPSLIGRKVTRTDKWLALIQTRQSLIIGDVQKDTRFEKWDGTSQIRGWMGIPMTLQEKVIGFINLDSHQPNTFTERDATLAQTFANSAAVAVQNAYLFRAEREQRKREESMLELMRVITSTLEVDDVMQTILRHIINLIPSDSGTIQLLEGDKLRITATQGFDKDVLIKGQILPLQDSTLKQQALETTRPIWVNDTHNDQTYKFFDGAENVNSFMAIPLVYKGSAIGLATLNSYQTGRYTMEDADFAFALANQAAIAIGNASLYQQALQASERRAVLHRISQDIVRFHQEAENIYRAIHESTGKLMPCDVFMITLTNEFGESTYVYTMEGNVRYELNNEPSKMGLPGKVLQNGASVILKNVEEIDREGFRRFGSPIKVKSAIAVPLRIREKLIGVISAQSYEQYSYGNEEQALLEMLATHAATAIDNLRLYNETEQRLKEMETINRMSSSMRKTQSQQIMLEILLSETLSILASNSGSIWIFDPQEDQHTQRIAFGTAEKIKIKQLNRMQGVVGHVFSTGEVYISPELANDPLLYEENRETVPTGMGGAGIPIQSTAGIIGVLMVQVEPSHLTPQQINLLTTLAGIAGNAIHRAELFDQSQEQIRKLTTLREIDSAITSSTDLRVTLNILTDHTLHHLKVDAVDILLYHPELQSLSFYCSTGFRSQSASRPLMRISDGLAGQVVMKGGVVQVSNLKESNVRDPFLMREEFIAYVGVPVIVKGHIKGVFEVYNRSPLTTNEDWMQFLLTLAGQAAIAIDNSQLFDNLQKSNDDLKRAYDTTLEGWARALELRDRETEGHTRRVTDMTMQLAQYLNLPDDQLENIYRGVLLHDIGKMGVPDHILRKTGPLNDVEWVEMRRHPQYAYDLLSPIQYLKPALDIPYCHHEHWDGSGYPRGLKGEEIPLAARIFSVVDIWDALLSNRPYRNAWTEDKVVKYLKGVSGTVLDPSIVQSFLNMIEDHNNKTG